MGGGLRRTSKVRLELSERLLTGERQKAKLDVIAGMADVDLQRFEDTNRLIVPGDDQDQLEQEISRQVGGDGVPGSGLQAVRGCDGRKHLHERRETSDRWRDRNRQRSAAERN